jgi:hypothetical protein
MQQKASALAELHKAVMSTQDILAAAKTVFPFTLFPHQIIIDRSQVTVTHRTFFMVGGLTSIRIEDILNVTVEVGPFFGTLKLTTRYFNAEAPYVVNYLWRRDALRLKAIINGLVIAAKKDIDADAVETKQLVKGVEQLGQSTLDESP